MASKKNKPPAARKRDGIHFVNARPSSNEERITAQRLVRAHVGRWISDQTKDRSTPFESSAPPRSLNSLRDSTSPLPTSSSGHGPSSYSLVSRPSPYSTQPAHVLPHSLPVSLDPVPEREWQRSPFPPSHASDSSDSSDDASTVVNIPHDPTAIMPWRAVSPIEPLISSALDPFSTQPSRLRTAVVNICEEYCLKVLWPGLIPTRDQSKETGQMWFPLARSDPALFSSFMFASLCHRRMQWLNGSVPRDSFDRQLEQALELCELESIELISQAMRDPSRMFSDAVLLSVICMAHHGAMGKTVDDSLKTRFNPPLQRLQWVDVYGSLAPNMFHIRGLLQLVSMRGGLRNIQTLGLRPTIGFSDILTACVQCSRPVFEFWPLDPSRNGISIYDLLDFDQSDVDYGFGRLQGIGVTPQMAEAFQGAQAYIGIVKACLTTSYEPSLLADQRNLAQFTILSLPPVANMQGYFNSLQSQEAPSEEAPSEEAPSEEAPPEEATYEACRLAAMIFGVGVIFPIPAKNTPLDRLAQELYTVLHDRKASTLWSSPNTRIPLLWILTLGGIAASETTLRSFFARALGLTARRSGLSSWSHLKRRLEIMPWFDLACDEAGESLWRETRISCAPE